MRFWLGHRLPGGFWGGVSTYGYRRSRQYVHKTRHTATCLGWAVFLMILAGFFWPVALGLLGLFILAEFTAFVFITVKRHRGAVVYPGPKGPEG